MPPSDSFIRPRPRCLILALLLMPVNAYWIIEIEVMWYAGHPTTISLFFNVIVFLVGITAANQAVKRWWPGQALNPAELLIIYVMLSMASAVCGHDTIQVITSVITYPFYAATPENGWQTLVHPHLPEWMTMSDPVALKGFYEGNSSLYLPENYLPWIRPALTWSAFLSVLVFTTVCLNVLLRKEWTENERLSFPVVELPLKIATQPRSLVLNRYFLAGFGIAGFISLMNGLNHLFPDLPQIPVKPHNLTALFRSQGHPWNAMDRLLIAYYPSVIGLSYLMPLDLMFSCWFFFLFWKAERIMIAWLGLSPTVGPYYETQQAAGGYLAIAVGALWIGRAHLKEAGKRVLGLESKEEDQGEAMSYRAASIGALLGLAALILFSWDMGLNPLLGFLYFVLYLGLSVGIARMRATCGPPAHDLHFSGPEVMLTTSIGTEHIGASSLGVMTLFFGFNRAYRAHPMAHSLEGFRLAERTGSSYRTMFVAQMVAVVAGCLCAFWAILHLCYASPDGAPWLLSAFGGYPMRRMAGWVQRPEPSDGMGIFFYILGFLIVLLMPTLKWISIKIPFHPIGFAISTSWSMNLIWFPVFIAWCLKAYIVKYSGGAGYRRFIPFFMGLVLGDYLVGGFWCLFALGMGEGQYAFWP